MLANYFTYADKLYMSSSHVMEEGMIIIRIDPNQAEEIAITFLRQHHSILKVEKPILKGKIWLVDVVISISGEKKRVEINAETGNILGWK